MSQLFSFLIVIGIIIFIHESGHFSMAKLFGIPVSTFSLGFGPKLFGFRRKETEYRISAIPLGGYVKIHGMEDQEANPEDPNSFYNRPRYQRFLVLFMGVGFNFLLAILFITIALNQGFQVGQSSEMPALVGYVMPDSPAAKADLQPGDVILQMDGRKTPTWQEVHQSTMLNPDESISIQFRRGNQVMEKTVRLDREPENGFGILGVAPVLRLMIAEVVKGKPAEKAGLLANDVVKSINGNEVHSVEWAVSAVQNSGGKPIPITVERKEGAGKVDREFSITPAQDNGVWKIGVAFTPDEPMILKKLSLPDAFGESFRTCKEQVALHGIYLSRLFQGKLTLKATSGPFGIAKMSQAARETGLSRFLLFIGIVSFDIGLINLLPIPALDGGHLFFLMVEGVIRRELSIKLKERVTMVGFFFLIGVMVVVLYYDILKTGPIQKLLQTIRN
jgi:regulator of sigma E protease